MIPHSPKTILIITLKLVSKLMPQDVFQAILPFKTEPANLGGPGSSLVEVEPAYRV